MKLEQKGRQKIGIALALITVLCVSTACAVRWWGDPLHSPVLKPTTAPTVTPTIIPEEATPIHAAQARSVGGNGIRCDLNNDGVCNAVDVLIVRGDISATAAATAKTPRPTATPRATNTPRPATQTPVLTLTKTATPQRTATATTRASVTPLPTAAPTATPIPPTEGGCLNCVDPQTLVTPPVPIPDVRGQACPAWAHDQWLVTGPNGKIYRTWHPAVQPNGLPGAGCYFNHSHGPDDPRKSKASPLLPAYGFEADMMGMAEPHAGFKTAWVNAGDCNQLENFCSTSDVKLTVHMGTAGSGRLQVEHHTFAFDMVGQGVNAGAEIHVNGMASTGDAATQCDPAPDTSGPRGFRILAMPKDQALACNIFGPYEVWQFHLTVGGTVIASKFATFDGITVARRQPNGAFTLESTDLTWENAPHSGCTTDVYFGGSYLSTNEDFTDMFGRQIIKRGPRGPEIVLDTVGKNTYKRPFDGCGPVPYAVN